MALLVSLLISFGLTFVVTKLTKKDISMVEIDFGRDVGVNKIEPKSIQISQKGQNCRALYASASFVLGFL
jgi:hypothetical protein